MTSSWMSSPPCHPRARDQSSPRRDQNAAAPAVCRHHLDSNGTQSATDRGAEPMPYHVRSTNRGLGILGPFVVGRMASRWPQLGWLKSRNIPRSHNNTCSVRYITYSLGILRVPASGRLSGGRGRGDPQGAGGASLRNSGQSACRRAFSGRQGITRVHGRVHIRRGLHSADAPPTNGAPGAPQAPS